MKPGIYIHIPFCKSRCSYCDFATDVYRNEAAVERYVDALIKEMSGKQSEVRSPKSEVRFGTLYFGGGTPSLLSAGQLEKILETLHGKFEFGKDFEFTLEMNPATVSLEKLKDFRSLGVNRASFGVQTFDDRALKILARGHDADDARQTFELLRKAGFENISFDLIGGLPNQTLADWDKNLTEAINLNPEHLSLYLLEIHEGTPLAGQIRSGRQPVPDEDLAGEMYQLMCEKVSKQGFEQYEISNFAKKGYESKHNNKYWLLEPVFGFGVSAHSFDGNKTRWSNERDTNRYVSLLESGKSPVVERETLSAKQLSGEFAFLNLRLTEGLDLIEYERRYGKNPLEEYVADLKIAEKTGLIEFSNDRLRLTPKGRLFSNEVFEIFV